MKKNRFLLGMLATAGFFPGNVHASVGYLYESDNSTGTVFQFTSTVPGAGKVALATGLTGVRGLAFDHAGNLFAGQNDRIVKIAPNRSVSTFASDLNGPNFLAVDRAGNLFATDRTGSVLRFATDGTLGAFVLGLEKPSGLAFDYAGNLFVADNARNAIYKFAPNGTGSLFASNLKSPQGLAFDRFGTLYAVNGATGTVEVFTQAGVRSTRFYNLSSPVGIAIDQNDALFIAENCNASANRIQKFEGTSVTGVVIASGLGCPLQLAFEPPRDPLLNLSTRARVDATPGRELIEGFIITGNADKKVLLRGIGPSLAKFGVSQPLPDSTLALQLPNNVFFNDDWMSSQKDAIQSTGLAPTDSREAAILATLPAANYTAVLRGKTPLDVGVGSVEIYDLDVGADSALANISSRGFVQSGDDRMIAGVILGARNGAGKILIRALGPSLRTFGVTEPLPDPTVSLFDANGTLLATNDNWADNQPFEIMATGIPPDDRLEAAIVATIPEGAFTAVVQDATGHSGVALVEIYRLN
jgi:hypothetical protein